MRSTKAVQVSIQAVSPLSGTGAAPAAASAGESATSASAAGSIRRGRRRRVLELVCIVSPRSRDKRPQRWPPRSRKLLECTRGADFVPLEVRRRAAARAPGAVRGLHCFGAAASIPASIRGRAMRSTMEPFRIDEIARRLLERVPPALRSMRQDLESNFRAVLRERLSKLDLVSRDEFDAQARVLERTRARLEQLEARLAALEGGAPASGAPQGSGSGAAPTR